MLADLVSILLFKKNGWLTKVPEFAHVGKDGGKVQANDTFGYLLDSKADNFVSTTDGCRTVRRHSYAAAEMVCTY